MKKTLTSFYIIGWLTFLFLTSCNRPDKPVSFYYWKTVFHLDALEKETLESNSVKAVYVRYFDIDYQQQDAEPIAVSPIVFDSSAKAVTITPVVYIKNRTFERLDYAGVANLSKKVATLVTEINRSINQSPKEIQFDCDWTDATKDKYFLFIKQYRIITNQTISATIRLHQIKYPVKTGIPPVNFGVLMYYNMGEIGPGADNSIYEKKIATQYLPALKSYPVNLDLALPIFSWALLVREGEVAKLLNKMNLQHFQNDSNFTSIQKNRFVVKHACFHGGYYFQEKDVVKIEYVTEENLLEMATEIKKYSNSRVRNVIFYDLDKVNLVLYDKNIFQQVLDRLN